MGSSDWFELETLSDEIAHSQTRLSAARKTQNHGLVKLLQREIAEAEKWRSRLLGHITTRLGSPDPAQQAAHAEPWNVQADTAEEVQAENAEEVQADNAEAEQHGSESVAEAEQHGSESVAEAPETGAALPDPAARTAPIEGDATLWDQLSRTDLERL